MGKVSCKDCPDRSVEPNCHNTCKVYKELLQGIKEQKEAKIKENKLNDYFQSKIHKTKGLSRRKHNELV